MRTNYYVHHNEFIPGAGDSSFIMVRVAEATFFFACAGQLHNEKIKFYN